jgi:hypothetical protein
MKHLRINMQAEGEVIIKEKPKKKQTLGLKKGFKN